jgi:hypothetical protein
MPWACLLAMVLAGGTWLPAAKLAASELGAGELQAGELQASELQASELQAGELAGARPNIVVVLTDDQGYGDISAHGNPVLKTPNLDKLRSESLRFTDFHVSPTCAPTRPSSTPRASWARRASGSARAAP